MEITNHSVMVYRWLKMCGLNKMSKEKKKREVYHDGDGILRYTNSKEEKKRISKLNKDEEPKDENPGENLD